MHLAPRPANLVVIALGALAAAPALCAPSVPVILISVDTLRADHLGSYGYPRQNSKAIDSISRAGTRFTQASTAVPLTLPSHTALFTSRYPFANGVRDNGE